MCAGEVLLATAAALACSLARIAATLSSLGAAGAGCADAVAPLEPFEAADGYPHESALAVGDPDAACLAGVQTRAAGPASSKGRGYWWR